MNIVLIGFRCTGKTSVGRALAEKLERDFIDADDFLEERQGHSIARIFEVGGEKLFRRLEREVIRELGERDDLVLAVGGGAVMDRRNVRDLKRNGVLVLLECDPETIYERMTRDPRTTSQRPALTAEKELRAEIDSLLAKRRPYYHKAADLTVDSSRWGAAELADKIIELCQQKL
jgi:shikimate kinase